LTLVGTLEVSVCIWPKAKARIFLRAAATAALLLVSARDEQALAESGCLSSASSLHQPEIDAFLVRPADLLLRYPAGGPAMSAHVQRLAASDPSTVHALIALAAEAKPAHVVALGIGLGRAAAHCAAKRPDLALMIKQRVAADGSASLRALFTSEATVTELAMGAPPEFGLPPSPEGIDRTAGTRTASPSAATRIAIISARPPGVLLPVNFGVPLGSTAETRDVIASQSSGRASASAGASGSSTPSPPPGSETDAAVSSLDADADADFFAFFRRGINADAHPDDDEELPAPSPGKGSSVDVDRARWSPGGDNKRDSFFGSGGVVHSAQESVSPTH
jgi:hypothetical protein